MTWLLCALSFAAGMAVMAGIWRATSRDGVGEGEPSEFRHGWEIWP